MRTPGRTVWTGAQVNANAPLALNKRNSLRPTAPAAIAGKDYGLGFAAFGPLAVQQMMSAFRQIINLDGKAISNNSASQYANDTAIGAY